MSSATLILVIAHRSIINNSAHKNTEIHCKINAHIIQ